MTRPDAVVVGAGPNGLVAAVTLARAGLAVEVYEAAATVGGGARTEELTLPGFRHDPCSAVHPHGAGSPALRAMPLDRHGLAWVHPDLPMAHPLPDGSAGVLSRSLAETVAALGADGRRYRRLMAPFVGRWNELAGEVLRPVLASRPRHPVLLARLGLLGLPPASALARLFREPRTRALIAGMAAHAIAPLTAPITAATALIFALAGHDPGWPFPRGGSQGISDALASYLRSLGGVIHTGRRVRSIAALPEARAYLFDTSPEDLLAIAGERLSPRYHRRLARYRRGSSVFKVDYALSGPVPWTAEACRRAGTVHVGASFEEIAAALDSVHRGGVPDPPFLITAQPSVFDPSRAPEGRHVFWVYAHAPRGWPGNLVEAIERQLERFAPGFRDLVLARASAGPPQIAERNPNNVGGDIMGGEFAGRQAFFRPIVARMPYATGNPAIFLCSSSTPPGPGVHGMCGHHAARLALARVYGVGRELVF